MPYYLVKREECHDCGGKGEFYDPHCRKCGRQVTQAYLLELSPESLLPCGHRLADLDEITWCVECEGEGVLEGKVLLSEALADLGVFPDRSEPDPALAEYRRVKEQAHNALLR